MGKEMEVICVICQPIHILLNLHAYMLVTKPTKIFRKLRSKQGTKTEERKNT